ncbi:MAG: Gfo/Idh/MocA family oxidoreductase [Planctomycetota bacterium]|nr:Gfo/Idh/MocA family oxidoreductase [Planctomycetota bacterium]
MTPPPLDRRAFVVASAATAASAILSSNVAAQNAASGKRNAKIRVGLVGCGGRGTGAAGDALNADPDVELVAVGDVLAGRIDTACAHFTEKFPGRADVPKDKRFVGFDALEKVLASGLDAVLLATPPVFRPAQIEASVNAGVHIFAEKPFAVDAPGVRSVIASAKKAREKNLSLMSGFCWRSSLPERAIYQRIHEGGIGKIRTVYATYNGSPNAFVERKPNMTDMEWQILNWYHYLWLGGDHIVEQACHSVDKINWAMNNEPPALCWAVGGRAQRSDKHPGNIYDHFGVTYEWEDGRRAFLQARQWENCPTDNTDYVYGENGIAFINGWGPHHAIEGQVPWVYEGPTTNMYVEEHKDFFAGIRNGKHRFDADWATNSTLMAIMGRMAAYTGQSITWEQALNSAERQGPTTYALGPVETTPVPRPGHTKFT